MQPLKITISNCSFLIWECLTYFMDFNRDIRAHIFFLYYQSNQFLAFSEKQEFLPFLGNLIKDHWINPKIYINSENNPKNFAVGWVKLAPKKKLNRFLITIYKSEDGSSHISHSAELIKEKQLIFSRLWIKKLRDINVSDHLHIIVVVARE